MLFLRVIALFLVPTQHPLIMMKSSLTTPYLGNPPIGVIGLVVRSNSVVPLLVPAFPILKIFLLISVLW